MKFSRSRRLLTSSLFSGALLLLGLANPSHAQVLLVVNETDPSAVTITATGAFPSTNIPVGEYTLYDGVDLEGFFSMDGGYNTGPGEADGFTLATGDASGILPLNVGVTDHVSGPDQYLDLSLYTYEPYATPPETFTTDLPAFQGTLTLDLTGLYLAGVDGTIVAGFSGSTDGLTPIGTYEIVTPEPSIWMVVISGFSVLIFLLRRRANFAP